MIKVLLVFGTRPEAIKLCPVLLLLRRLSRDFRVRCCVTAQHRAMLDQVLQVFDVVPDFDLNLMQPGQSLAQLSAGILKALENILSSERPGIVLVQGDTTTTFCAALSAFYQHIPVGHVEAGLRTGDLGQPFPEELNRVLTTRLSTLPFAPTCGARACPRTASRSPGTPESTPFCKCAIGSKPGNSPPPCGRISIPPNGCCWRSEERRVGEEGG